MRSKGRRYRIQQEFLLGTGKVAIQFVQIGKDIELGWPIEQYKLPKGRQNLQ